MMWITSNKTQIQAKIIDSNTDLNWGFRSVMIKIVYYSLDVATKFDGKS